MKQIMLVTGLTLLLLPFSNISYSLTDEETRISELENLLEDNTLLNEDSLTDLTALLPLSLTVTPATGNIMHLLPSPVLKALAVLAGLLIAHDSGGTQHLSETLLDHVSKLINTVIPLNPSEQQLIRTNPDVAFSAFLSRMATLNMCEQQKLSDGESNACRHFVWTILLHEKLGPQWTMIILNIHENNIKNNFNPYLADTLNDHYNNKTALTIAQQLHFPKKNSARKKKIMALFHSALADGSLVVDQASPMMARRDGSDDAMGGFALALALGIIAAILGSAGVGPHS